MQNSALHGLKMPDPAKPGLLRCIQIPTRPGPVNKKPGPTRCGPSTALMS